MSIIIDVDAIIDQLKIADDAYFNDSGSSPMSDREYDRLKKRAFEMTPEHQYFARVGADVRGGKVRLPYQMGSLDQAHLGGGLNQWVTRHQLNGSTVIITEKLDGISCLLIYRNGELEAAYSRGNGMEGADITRHVKLISNIPQTIPDVGYLAVRGELIMPIRNFDDRWAGKFANPRVTVAGTMNRDKSNDSIIADIDFIAYEIVATDSEQPTTKRHQLSLLTTYEFSTPLDIPIAVDDKFTEATMTSLLKRMRATSHYELDGIVITADVIESASGKRNSSSLNPEHSCKFKINDESDIVHTEVVEVLWDISKSAFLKPRVRVRPITLFGTTVTYATGFNAKFIYENKIGPGAKVAITKSGTVIPYITDVVSPGLHVGTPPADLGDWEWNASQVEAVLVDGDSHEMVIFMQVLDFVEKLNVELLKESSLAKLYDEFDLWGMGFTDAILIIIDLASVEWSRAIGSNGVKSYASLHRRLQNMELATLIGAAKFMGFGFGIRKAKQLIVGAGDKLWNLTESEVAAIDGFGSTAGSVVDGLVATKSFVDTLVATGMITFISETKTNELSAVNVVMTGFRDNDLSSEIERRGGKIGSGVSKKTTHLLTTDPSSNSGKAKKARELGVPVMGPDEFKDLYNL